MTMHETNDLRLLAEEENGMSARPGRPSLLHKTGKLLFCGLTAMGLAGALSARGDLYVNIATGNDGNDNPNSAERPYKTLQRAITRLNELKVDGVVIHVAPGTYAPANSTFHGHEFPRLNFSVVGEGTAENPVVIDGGGSNACFRITNSKKIGAFSNIIFRNGLHYSGGGIGCLAGWTTSGVSGVTNCVFENCHSTNGCGGAVMSYGYTTSFSNCTFRNCSAVRVDNGSWSGQVKNGCGGAVMLYAVKGDCDFTACSFETNAASGSGGAVMMQVDDAPGGTMEHSDIGLRLTDCTFVGNTSGGQGIVNGIVRSCERTAFTGNSASWGSVWFLDGYLGPKYGGAYFVTNRFVNCTFTDNLGTNVGCFGWSYSKRFEFEHCTFAGNTSLNGAAVLQTDGHSPHCFFRDCTFSRNAGEGVLAVTSHNGANFTLELARTVFTENDAGAKPLFQNLSASRILNSCFSANCGGSVLDFASGGGGVYHTNTLRNCLLDHNTNTVNEGILRIFWTLAETADVCNNTFVDNVATDQPSALWINSVASYEDLGCHYANNLFFANRKTDGTSVKQTAGVFNSFATNNWIEVGGTTLADGTRGNIVGVDPKFTNRADGDYTISAASACRDCGAFFEWMTGACDIRANPKYPRVTGAAPDIGCYEWLPERYLTVIVR